MVQNLARDQTVEIISQYSSEECLRRLKQAQGIHGLCTHVTVEAFLLECCTYEFRLTMCERLMGIKFKLTEIIGYLEPWQEHGTRLILLPLPVKPVSRTYKLVVAAIGLLGTTVIILLTGAHPWIILGLCSFIPLPALLWGFARHTLSDRSAQINTFLELFQEMIEDFHVPDHKRKWKRSR